MLRVVAWSTLCLVVSACAVFGPDARASRLLRDARESVERRDLDSAWRSLVRVHREHPSSPYDAEAFTLAADVFRAHYDRDRVLAPDSPWATREARFMIEWLVSLLSRPEQPRAQARALFLGTSYGYFREYLSYLDTRDTPILWTVRVEEDNGIIQAVEVEASAEADVDEASGG